MKTYAALGEKSSCVGGFSDCVYWALDSVDKGLEAVYQIVRCRAGESDAKVIAPHTRYRTPRRTDLCLNLKVD